MNKNLFKSALVFKDDLLIYSIAHNVFFDSCPGLVFHHKILKKVPPFYFAQS